MNEDDRPAIETLRTANLAEFFDYLEDQPEELKQEWIVDGIVTAGGNALLAADQKFAKTYFIISLALSVASGRPFMGKEVLRPGPVFMHSPEGSRRLLGKRLKEVTDVMGLRFESLPLIISQEYSLKLNDKSDQARIEEQLHRDKFVLQIFDPLKNCFNGSLYSPTEVGLVEDFLRHLNADYGVTNFIAHHMTKGSNSDPTKNVKGDGGWTAMMDDIITGKKHGVRGRSLEFEQRQGMSHKPIYFMLPEIEGQPMQFELCTEEDVRAVDSDGRVKALVVEHLETITEDDRGWLVKELRAGKGSNADHSAAVKILENTGKIIRVKKKLYLHPENGGENPAVLELCPREEADTSASDGQKSPESAEKVLSEKPVETPAEEKRTEVEPPDNKHKSLFSRFFSG